MPSLSRSLRFRAALPLAAALLASACAGPRRPPPAPGPALRCGGACTDSVGVTYLGVGGFLVRRGGDAVLTAPHFTRPNAWRVARNDTVSTDTAYVDARVAELLPDSLRRKVRAVLLGHAHYDHLMDVPYLLRRWFPAGVKVYGNDAMVATLWYDAALRRRMVGVEGGVGTREEAGRWWTPPEAPGVRFMAVKSEHAPHLFGASLLPYRPPVVRTAPPERPKDWPEGQTLAYLVDFRDPDGRVRFRLHYQDAASTPPLGFPPPLGGADRAPVDVAILCGGNSDEVRGYPNELLRALQPRFAVIGHWEDFLFGRRGAAPRRVPATDFRELGWRIDRVLGRGRRWQPQIGETRWFCVCPRDGSPPAASPAR